MQLSMRQILKRVRAMEDAIAELDRRKGASDDFEGPDRRVSDENYGLTNSLIKLRDSLEEECSALVLNNSPLRMSSERAMSGRLAMEYLNLYLPMLAENADRLHNRLEAPEHRGGLWSLSLTGLATVDGTKRPAGREPKITFRWNPRAGIPTEVYLEDSAVLAVPQPEEVHYRIKPKDVLPAKRFKAFLHQLLKEAALESHFVDDEAWDDQTVNHLLEKTHGHARQIDESFGVTNAFSLGIPDGETKGKSKVYLRGKVQGGDLRLLVDDRYFKEPSDSEKKTYRPLVFGEDAIFVGIPNESFRLDEVAVHRHHQNFSLRDRYSVMWIGRLLETVALANSRSVDVSHLGFAGMDTVEFMSQ